MSSGLQDRLAGPMFMQDTGVGVAWRGWLRRTLPFLTIAAIGANLAFVAYKTSAEADDARVRGVVELRAEWRARDFERKLLDLAVPIATARVLVASDSTVELGLFRRFAELARQEGNPIRRLIWAARVPRPDGAEQFLIRIEHAFGDYQQLVGRDMAAETVRRQTLERARDQGEPLSTPPIPFQGDPTKSGAILFWPVYHNGAAPPTVKERRAQLRGFVIGSWALTDALNVAVMGTPKIIETIHFFAGSPPSTSAPLATYLPDQGLVVSGGALSHEAPRGGIRVSRAFSVYGQDWRLVSDFSSAALAPLHSASVWAAPTVVLLLTLMLLAYVGKQQRAKAEVEIRVAAGTAELRDANESLQGEIAARQKTYEQLVHAQKMEAIGNLTGGMAHDFNNLLGIVIGNLDLLRDRDIQDPEIGLLTQEALDAAWRGAELTRRLLAFARRQPLEPRRVDVNELVESVCKLLRRTLGEQVEIVLELGKNVWPVVVDPAQLESTLANLANNARDAMPNGGRLRIATANQQLDEDYAAQQTDLRPGDYLLIEVCDTGTGMPPEVASHIFEPFYTTKEQGKGTGLGLSMVFGFIKQSGGHINVYSEIGIGTIFRLYLPRADRPAQTEAPSSSLPQFRGRGEAVLVVEDNAALRRTILRQLSELGYTAMEAADAQSALQLLETNPVDLLLSDVVMPGGTSGYDLAREVQRRWYNVRIVLASGFPDNHGSDAARPSGIRLLSKPFRREDLASAMHQALARPAAQPTV